MVAFPAVYDSAITTAKQIAVTITLEIEGWPTVYANRDLGTLSDWYGTTALDTAGGTIAARATQDQRTSQAQFFKSDYSDGKPMDFGFSAVALDLLRSSANMGTAKVSLADKDGSLAGLTATRRSAGAVLEYGIDNKIPTDNSTFTLYLGGDTTALAAASYFYLGRETFKRAGSIGGDGSVSVKRAQLGSTRWAHQGVFTADGSNGNTSTTPSGSDGDVVSAFPRHVIDRKAWIRVGYGATCDADCVLAFAGTIRNFGWEDAGLTLTISCEDGQSRLKRPIFTDLSTRWFPAGGRSAPQLTMTSLSPPSNFRLDQLPEDIAFSVGDRVCGIVANQFWILQVVSVASDGAAGAYTCSAQGTSLFATNLPLPDGLLKTGAAYPFRPMILVAKGSSDSTSQRYGLWPELANGLDANHVLSVLLMVLTSTGTAADFSTPGSNGAYDLLPAAWGLGIPQADINVAGITALASAAGARFRLVQVPVLDVVQDAREWLVNLLRPFGYALIVNAIGQIDVTSIDPLDPDTLAALPTLQTSDMAIGQDGNPAKMVGPVSSGDQRVIAVRWSDSPFIRDGKLELRQPITLQLTDDEDPAALNGSVSATAIEAWGLDSTVPGLDDDDGVTRTGCAFFIARNDTRGLSVLADLLSRLATRFGGAPAVITVEVWLRKSELSVGDFVKLTFGWAPTPFSATRGMAGTVAQITSRQVNLLRGTLDLELTISEAGNENVRFLSPSFVVSAWNSGTKTVTVVDTYAASGKHDLDAITAALVSAGTELVFAAFGGTKATTGKSGAVAIASKGSSTTLTFAASPLIHMLNGATRAPLAGDTIRLADYADQVAAAKTRFAYEADAIDEELGGADSADVWS